jgi:hypothetical protein
MVPYVTVMLQQESGKVVTAYVYGATRSILCGAGLNYAVDAEKYLHIPLVVLFPSAYAGYHTYKNKDRIMWWISNIVRRPPPW